MLCVESQYQSYLIKKGMPIDKYELLLNEVGQGSIKIKFIKSAVDKLFEEYVFPEFIKSLQAKIDAILRQTHLRDEDTLTVRDFRELFGITSVLSHEYQARMFFETVSKDEQRLGFNINGTEANAVVSECQRQIEAKEKPTGEQVQKVVLHWKQAGDKSRPLSIDKGVIDDVDAKRMVKIVCNESLKGQMISDNDKNPFNMFFVVDAEVKRVAGKPVAYVISKIHDSGEIPD